MASSLYCTLARRGRLALIFGPRDLWVGAFIGKEAVYVIIFPMLALRWSR